MYDKGYNAGADIGLHEYALYAPLIMETLILLSSWNSTSYIKSFLARSELVGVIQHRNSIPNQLAENCILTIWL